MLNISKTSNLRNLKLHCHKSQLSLSYFDAYTNDNMMGNEELYFWPMLGIILNVGFVVEILYFY